MMTARGDGAGDAVLISAVVVIAAIAIVMMIVACGTVLKRLTGRENVITR
jgi:hypothetical protein